jgi:putative DNA primase/helicase
MNHSENASNVHPMPTLLTIKPVPPCYACYPKPVQTKSGHVLVPGLYFHGMRDNKEVDMRICSPLEVLAVTRDSGRDNYGRLVRYRPTDATEWRQLPIPMELLAGDGAELRATLLRLGVTIERKQREALLDYLMNSQPERVITAATCTGWHGSRLFVMPNRIIGAEYGEVVFQPLEAGGHEFVTGGELAGWQDEVAALCTGNPVLMLAVCAALAGPLLTLLDVDGGGFHLLGDSSSGKSIALAVACSVWGKPGDFLRTWNATNTGLEGVATVRNDTFLPLDEIGEARPQDVGNIIYALANGTGKQRGGVTGLPRAVRRWRVMVLSSGEMTMGKHMESAGMQSKAGQELRLLDIPTYRRYGAYDDLHGHAMEHDVTDANACKGAGRPFADALKRGSSKHYGYAGPALVEVLVLRKGRVDEAVLGDELSAELEEMRQAFPANTGQEARAATRFAVVALAGELAIQAGLLPWEPGSVRAAMVEMYEAWIGLRGHGQSEEVKILRSVLGFIDRHSARFADASSADAALIHNRAGWWRGSPTGRQYLFLPEALTEAAPGYDIKRITACLNGAEVLAGQDKGKYLSTKVSVPGGDRPRVYVISYAALQKATEN